MPAMTLATTTTGLNTPLVGRALTALINYLNKQKANEGSKALLDSEGIEDQVYAVLGLSKVPSKGSTKPYRLAVPHPVLTSPSGSVDEIDICLFVKDGSLTWIKDFLKTNALTYVTPMSLTKLRTDHSTYAQKRHLLQSYDFFLSDARILPMLSKCLGKAFFGAKKQPVPVNITRKESLAVTIGKALTSTYLYVSTGTSLSLKLGRASALTPAQLSANAEAAVVAAVKKLGGWKSVKTVGLKVGQSACVPVYSRTTGELRGMAGGEGEGEEEEKKAPAKRKAVVAEEEEEKVGKAKKVRKEKSPLLKALKEKKEKKVEKKAEKKAEEKEAALPKKATSTKKRSTPSTAVSPPKKSKVGPSSSSSSGSSPPPPPRLDL